MESYSINETPQVSNHASQDANFQITCFTEIIGEDIQNAFLVGHTVLYFTVKRGYVFRHLS